MTPDNPFSTQAEAVEAAKRRATFLELLKNAPAHEGVEQYIIIGGHLQHQIIEPFEQTIEQAGKFQRELTAGHLQELNLPKERLEALLIEALGFSVTLFASLSKVNTTLEAKVDSKA